MARITELENLIEGEGCEDTCDQYRAELSRLVTTESNMSAIKPRKRAGSFELFARRYDPVDLPDGTIMQDEVPPDVTDRHIWTVVEGDNNKNYVVPGRHYVNRLGYVVCTVPWCDVEEQQPGYVY